MISILKIIQSFCSNYFLAGFLALLGWAFFFWGAAFLAAGFFAGEAFFVGLFLAGDLAFAGVLALEGDDDFAFAGLAAGAFLLAAGFFAGVFLGLAAGFLTATAGAACLAGELGLTGEDAGDLAGDFGAVFLGDAVAFLAGEAGAFFLIPPLTAVAFLAGAFLVAALAAILQFTMEYLTDLGVVYEVKKCN